MKHVKISKKHLPIFLFITSLAALVSAYIAEYYFKLLPCELCLLQRKPFVIIIVLCAIIMFLRLPKKLQQIITSLTLLALTTNIFIASYHVGIENGIFPAPTSCSPAIINTDDLEKLEKIITQMPAIRCDKPVLIFGSISMAFFNMTYCILILIVSFTLKKKK